ncbi:MAG: serine/threonine protein kinase [Myxococcales bacterium]|nr:serine/threonine protein kinase [Myxococcales bacterium]MCB9629159.1 serine/threonine protein kinase [Sandaracinaceae bacterium]
MADAQPPPTLVSRSIGALRLSDRLGRRLAFAAWASAGLTVLFLATSHGLAYLDLDPRFTAWQREASPLRLWLAPCFLVFSLAFAELVRTRVRRTPQLVAAGVAFEVVAAFFVACLVNGRPWSTEPTLLGVSPIAIWVLIYAALVPLPPRAVVVGALASALMDPLGLWVMVLADDRIAMPPVILQVWRFFPSFVCAGLAYAVARMIDRLEEHADEAHRMGSYRLRKLLGRGGMAEVWEADHRMLARPAAVKLVRPEWLEDDQRSAETMLQRFQREVSATSALCSPHTIAVYDFGIAHDGTFFYAMERLHGIDLHSLIQQYGPLPAGRVVFILRQICHSLEEAHRAGLVHRDVKPANIFVCRYGLDLDFVKVLDFGLVKGDPPGIEHQSLTREGAHTGTPAFLPPEIALGKVSEADGRADLYGVGCVAYWLLTGKLVFPLGPSLQMIAAHAHDIPELPSRRGQVSIPPQLEAIVMQLLAKAPADRPPSAEALSRRLADTGLEAAWTVEAREAWWGRYLPASQSTPEPGSPKR